MIRICAIDPGYKNLAICVEEFNLDILSQNNDIKSVYNNGQILFWDKVCFEKSVKKVLPKLLLKISMYFDRIDYLLKSCSLILIEEQMRTVNFKATRIAHHIQSHLLLRGHTNVLFIDPKEKLKTLGFKRKRGDKDKFHKEWVSGITKAILKERQDFYYYDYLMCYKSKMDDLSDCLLMIQMAKIKYKKFDFIPLSEEKGIVPNFVRDFRNGTCLITDNIPSHISLFCCHRGHRFTHKNYKIVNLFNYIWCPYCNEYEKKENDPNYKIYTPWATNKGDYYKPNNEIKNNQELERLKQFLYHKGAQLLTMHLTHKIPIKCIHGRIIHKSYPNLYNGKICNCNKESKIDLNNLEVIL